MQISVKEVTGKSELMKFIKFPHKLYKDSKQYVPQLDSQEKGLLTKSPSLEYCKIKMWLAYSANGEVIGRIAGIINPKSNEIHKTHRVRFGWFDFVENEAVAQQLMQAVTDWGKSAGMDEVQGPLGFNTWNRQGMLVEGYENTPPVNCLYNYPYYNDYMNSMGFKKDFDWIQLKLDASQKVPEKMVRIHDMIMEKYKLHYLDIKKMTNRDEILKSFFEEYNETFKSVENFVPLSDAEIKDIADHYFPMLKPELTSFIMDENNKVAAFSVCFPSLSEAFKKAKGKLFPFGWYHIMKAYKKYDTLDFMMSGVSKKWQSKGLSSLYHVYMERSLAGRDVSWGITNPQSEHNSAYKVWERYNSEPFMRRRCYLKKI
jgi:hypothetical protein